MAPEVRFALSIEDQNAGVSPETVSESGRSIRSAVDERVAPQTAEPTIAEIFQGELEAHWDWATDDMDASDSATKTRRLLSTRSYRHEPLRPPHLLAGRVARGEAAKEAVPPS